MRTIFAALLLLTSVSGQDAVPQRPPQGAVVLFDGQDDKSTDAWVHRGSGEACRWKVDDETVGRPGSLVVVPGTKDLVSKRHFTDFSLHLEFCLPKTKEGTPWQGRSNSGVYLQGRYEIQILDSYGTKRLRAGDCGGIYGQKPADRNAAVPAERWQTYDIHFTAPRFDGQKRTHPPRVSVRWNGVLVHDDVAIKGPTTAHAGGDPSAPGPILLQDHGNPVRYRNIHVVPHEPQTVSKTHLSLGSPFGKSMVLQQGQPIPVWGRTSPEVEVVLEMAGTVTRTKAGSDGRFRANLSPLSAGGPHQLVVTAKDAQMTLGDILVGEVWVCSGQSNMRWRVHQSNNAEKEMAAATHSRLRLATVKQAQAKAPKDSFEMSWTQCTPESVRDFSGVGYFFGRDLLSKLDVPIGLVMTAVGGTPVEAWTPGTALREDPVIERWEHVIAKNARDWRARLAKWEGQAREAAAEGRPAPKKPRRPRLRRTHEPAVLWNAMVAPLVPYGIRGVIWYQGEANASRAWQYRRLFPLQITSWRNAWGQGDFPFLFVQLANFRKRHDLPTESDWAELRDAQAFALTLPNTGMATAIDIGAARDIHPRNKQEVGRRLALAARRRAYGEDTLDSGPSPEHWEEKGSSFHLRFKETGGKLQAANNEPVRGFAIAGSDRKFHWATARVDGNTVVLTSDAVPSPVAARYAWADNPACNLVNAAGLPAPPFRTDQWPGVTAGKER